MVALTLFVPGLPIPQGSMRAFVARGRAHMAHDNRDSLATWRASITQAAAHCWGGLPPLDEPVNVTLDFWLHRPVSAPRYRRHPDRRPDLDKLTRAVFDALTGVVFTDDARVVWLLARKFYAIDHPLGARIVLDRMLPAPFDPGPGSRRAERTSQARDSRRVPSAVGNQTTPAGAGIVGQLTIYDALGEVP
jgi:crossover junction endodeoxyribonuclease RusA